MRLHSSTHVAIASSPSTAVRVCQPIIAAHRSQAGSVGLLLSSSDQRGHRLQAAAAGDESDQPTQFGRQTWDVSSNVISPSYRSTPWAAEDDEQQGNTRSKARILFVGECNVCRSVLAEAMMRQLLRQHGLQDVVECDAKGSRDYNEGSPPEPAAMAVLEEHGLTLDPPEYAAKVFEPDRDIVHYDLVLVMDKFTAADVLREVSSYDLINKAGNYSQKVRRLGEFHPVLKTSTVPDGQDIDDPLYGNWGGESEEVAVRNVASLIEEGCQGLLQFLIELQDVTTSQQAGQEAEHEAGQEAGQVSGQDGAVAAVTGGSSGGLAAALRKRVQSMEDIKWLVPPMLQGRVSKTAKAGGR